MATINYSGGTSILLAEYKPNIQNVCPASFYFFYEFLGTTVDNKSHIRQGVYWESVVTLVQQKVNASGFEWYPTVGSKRPGVNMSRGFSGTLRLGSNSSAITIPLTFSHNDNIFLQSVEYGEEYIDADGYTCREARAVYREWGWQYEGAHNNSIDYSGGSLVIKHSYDSAYNADYTLDPIYLRFSNYIVIEPIRDWFWDTEDIYFYLYNPDPTGNEEVYTELVQADDHSKVIVPRTDLPNHFSERFTSLNLLVYTDPDSNSTQKHVRPELYEYMYDKTIADCHILVHYRANGATNFTTSSKTITIRLVEVDGAEGTTIADLYPVMTYAVNDINPVTLALTGNSKQLIRYHSNAEATLSVECKKGAKIASQIISSREANVGTDYYLFNGITDGYIKFSARDTRGYGASAFNPTIDFREYVRPTCNITHIGLPQVDDTCQVNISGMFWDDDFGAVYNTLTLWYRYKSTSIPEYVDWIKVDNVQLEDAHGYNYNAIATINLPNHVDSFTVQVMAEDKLGSAESGERTTRAYPIFDWSEQDFHFNIPVKIDGDLEVTGVITSNTPEAQQIEPADYIIEQGTRQTGSGNSLANWTFRKWNSGMYECWCRKHIQTGVSTAWGNMYVSGALPHTNLIWPGAFIDIPVANITIAPNASGAFLIAGGSTNLTATNTGGYEIARGISLSSGNFYINYYGMGRWK